MVKKKTKNKLYSLAEASEILGLAPTQLQYRIKTGKIEANKIGWFWTISQEEIDRYQEESQEE